MLYMGQTGRRHASHAGCMKEEAVVADVRDLVDADGGLVERRIFVDRDIYEQELERIFARCWLFLCHDSQIPNRETSSPPIWARTKCWQQCTSTCHGVVTRRYPMNMQMGLGHDGFDEDLMAWTSEQRFSESNHRHFYERWAELMAT